MQLSFYDWLIERYRLKSGAWKDNRYGDLACDIFYDARFPKESTDLKEISLYMECRIVYWRAQDTFKDTLKNYKKYIKTSGGK